MCLVLCAVSNRPRYFCSMLELVFFPALLSGTSAVWYLCYLAAVTTNPTGIFSKLQYCTNQKDSITVSSYNFTKLCN